MSHAEFKLVYEGPAVDSGSMDVRDLAPALLAVGNLVEAINRVLNGETATSKVQVKTVAAGSFSIGLDVGVSFVQSVRDILSGPDASAAANLLAFITGGAGASIGLLTLIKRLRGRYPTHVRRLEGNRVEVEFDGQTIEVDEPVARMAVDVTVRLSLERVIAEPLSKDGIESVSLTGVGATEAVSKPEGYFFLAPANRDLNKYEYKFRAPFSIISLSFKEGNKWRLHDGKTALNVTVDDQNYLARVNNNDVAFTKGDILICDVRVIAHQDDKGLRSEYFVERVVDQRHPPKQQSLFDEPKQAPQDPRPPK